MDESHSNDIQRKKPEFILLTFEVQKQATPMCDRNHNSGYLEGNEEDIRGRLIFSTLICMEPRVYFVKGSSDLCTLHIFTYIFYFN